MVNKYKTKQLSYWQGKFGDDYIDRNSNLKLFARRQFFFKELLLKLPDIKSVLEIGCNIGGNLMILNKINHRLKIVGIEPNRKAVRIAKKNLPNAKIIEKSVFDINFKDKFDLVFTCGVLIHIADENLRKSLEKIYDASKKYILAIEYYSDNRTAIPYRNLSDALFKRPYDKEYLNIVPTLKCLDKGFLDKTQGFDRCTYFLFEKQ